MAPPRRTYRTSQGKTVDLGALLLQNENVRAVGNMGVNARGDRIDNKGQKNQSRCQQADLLMLLHEQELSSKKKQKPHVKKHKKKPE
jgi:hypothetical protein